MLFYKAMTVACRPWVYIDGGHGTKIKVRAVRFFCGPQNAGKTLGASRFSAIWGDMQWLNGKLGAEFIKRVLSRLNDDRIIRVPGYWYLGELLDLVSRAGTMDRHLAEDWESEITHRRLLFSAGYVSLHEEKCAADAAAVAVSRGPARAHTLHNIV